MAIFVTICQIEHEANEFENYKYDPLAIANPDRAQQKVGVYA